jgi:hypothetical protein
MGWLKDVADHLLKSLACVTHCRDKRLEHTLCEGLGGRLEQCAYFIGRWQRLVLQRPSARAGRFAGRPREVRSIREETLNDIVVLLGLNVVIGPAVFSVHNARPQQLLSDWSLVGYLAELVPICLN